MSRFKLQIVDESDVVVQLPAGGAVGVRQSNGYVWDSTTLTWVAALQAGAGGGSTQVSVSGATFDSSGALNVNSGSAAGSTQVSVSTGNVQTRPQSTGWVTQAGFSVNSSNELLTQGSAGSTTVNVSSLAGKVTVEQNSTVWQVQQGGYVAPSTTVNVSSMAGVVNVQQNSTVWFTQAVMRDSSGVGFGGSTTRPSTGAMGQLVRTVLNDIQSTAFSTFGNGSTSNTVVSSVASLRHKVFAYSITSTVQAVNTFSFCSSLANVLWAMQLQSMSSGISGANLAVSPPAWLFATEAASPLVCKVTGSTGTYHVSFAYFTEA